MYTHQRNSFSWKEENEKKLNEKSYELNKGKFCGLKIIDFPGSWYAAEKFCGYTYCNYAKHVCEIIFSVMRKR